MRLGETQELFMRLVPRLIDKAHELGFEVRCGDLYRDPRAFGHMGKKKAYGKPYSNHKLKLAVDLNLFFDGKYMNKTNDHKELGEWWEELHPLCSWGGRFKDGNHYSIMYHRRK